MTLSDAAVFLRSGAQIRRRVWPTRRIAADYAQINVGLVEDPNRLFRFSIDDLVADDWEVIVGNAGVTPEFSVG